MQQIEQTLSSMEVAEMVEKTHKNLLRDIRRYCTQFSESKIEPVDFFLENSYKDEKGEMRPCYNVTKKGCEFIAHKMTGTKGTAFTAHYINRFHDMAMFIQQQQEQEQGEVIHYRTSKTLIPINDSWIKSRQEQIDRMCEMDNKTVLFAFQHIMKNLRDLFDIDEANRVFEQENGRHAENSVELINYFPQLQKATNSYLDKTEKKMIDWFKKKEEKNNDVKESNEQND